MIYLSYTYYQCNDAVFANPPLFQKRSKVLFMGWLIAAKQGLETKLFILLLFKKAWVQ
ncbi:MAG: hypothetical protein K0S61_4205 [Anaerocolumna sp.]|jgi:hypothetical protein|nr:hypothetical protein [Anaerocolumna sp.]